MSEPQDLSVEFIFGPSVKSVNREAAEAGLRRHAAIQNGAPYALEAGPDRWVAAIVHQAAGGPPFGGPPADDNEEAPGPKSEGPDDTASPSPDDSPSPDGQPPPDDDSDRPPKKDKGKGHELKEILDVLHSIAEALGLPLHTDTAVPGDDSADVSPPPGPGGPPGAPPGGSGGPPGPGGPGAVHQHIVHQRALKPGEVPPGGTPVGAPAFASVREDHPFAHLAGQVTSFETTAPIGDAPLADVVGELRSLASEIGYEVKRLGEGRDESGARIAKALISVH